jgi:hypothetical protein
VVAEEAGMKQRFLNQKLGKRMSRKAELQKAKTAAFRHEPQRRAPQAGSARDRDS